MAVMMLATRSTLAGCVAPSSLLLPVLVCSVPARGGTRETAVRRRCEGDGWAHKRGAHASTGIGLFVTGSRTLATPTRVDCALLTVVFSPQTDDASQQALLAKYKAGGWHAAAFYQELIRQERDRNEAAIVAVESRLIELLVSLNGSFHPFQTPV